MTLESPDRDFKWREILTPKPQTSNTSSSKVTAPYLHSTTAAPSLQGHFVRPHIKLPLAPIDRQASYSAQQGLVPYILDIVYYIYSIISTIY